MKSCSSFLETDRTKIHCLLSREMRYLRRLRLFITGCIAFRSQLGTDALYSGIITLKIFDIHALATAIFVSP